MKNERFARKRIPKQTQIQGGGHRVVCLLLIAVSSLASAQSSITRFTIDGGGGTSQGGTTGISGTVGQPDAGILSGGTIQIRGGFWVGRAGPEPATLTPTPTESLPTITPTPTGTLAAATETPTATLSTATPTETPPRQTPTSTPVETGLDVQPEILDEFIDALDVIEWVSRVRSSNSSPDVLFELSVFWQGEYPPSIETHDPVE